MLKKVGRNDPCSCGSGIKFKKCCGKSNVLPFSPLRLENELEELSFELVEFAFSNYKEIIEDITHDEMEMNLPEEEMGNESYASLLFSWIIINEPVVNNQTIYELFSQMKMSQIKNARVKKAFLSWGNAKSSIFEIVSIDSTNEESIVICEVISNESYTVMHSDSSKLNLGDFIVGTLLPFTQLHYFIFATVTISKEIKDHIEDVLDNYMLGEEIIHALFPEWTGNLLAPAEDELEWFDPSYEEVAMQFAYHMDRKGVDEDIILNGIVFWNEYSLKHQPYVTKTSTYAAALDYFINVLLLPENYVTQAVIAKEYEVSSGTISAHYRKFSREMDQMYLEYAKNLDDNVLD